MAQTPSMEIESIKSWIKLLMHLLDKSKVWSSEVSIGHELSFVPLEWFDDHEFDAPVIAFLQQSNFVGIILSGLDFGQYSISINNYALVIHSM